MNTTDQLPHFQNHSSNTLIKDKQHGFQHSTTIARPTNDVFEFCQSKSNVEKVLIDLPTGIENLFDLKLVSAKQAGADHFEIKWQNKPGAKIKADISFDLMRAPVELGTVLNVYANIEKHQSSEEGPSDLIKIFIRRMKALIETGEIATTTGQPSGREELKQTEKKLIH